MKRNYIYKITCALLVLVIGASCKKEYRNPSGANSGDVLTTAKGLTGVTVGLHKIYIAGRLGIYYNSVSSVGFVTNEIILMNSGNIPELQLATGGNSVDGTNTILLNLWTYCNKTIFDADNVINNAGNLPDKTYASGLIAYASLFKALALGNMAQSWERIPSGIGQNVTFISRVDGLNKAIAVIDNALAVIAANNISSSFLGNMPPGIDIQNTLYAIKARYALFAGNYPLALSAANSVDLTKKSTFTFDAQTLNPIFEIATSTNNVFQPTNANLGLSGIYTPDAGDKRLAFYTVPNATAPTARLGGFGLAGVPIPLYLPGEITLIKAEVYARQATPDPVLSLARLNDVVTKQPAADPFGVGAGLLPIVGPLTPAQLLPLIYKHRCIELYLSGLKLEDMRRFGLPTADRKRNFFPYPFSERDNNTNTPADPTF
ncbi:RagB/SusD family nutrient uptake outer membrane protein [Pedobacter sp. MC2016-24]|uniref:RagB/SusD family nutrient uptake outer membrane protein n=1 Tax=Pedobacter sp. MC2016-24 TaxID=2780090 RepID=UPI00187E7482|nr:RagB/SusD family nutrient uptake outer membrane protein [Pedobacter sp. MC2016-24]MBE9600502.1 RagB/SusD family nutrient uptake outer membrane protein [Pedobacter sp. MC2016-24]